MDQFELLKHIIADCDETLKESFVRRMEASIQVAQNKMDKGTPIYNDKLQEDLLARVTYGLSPQLMPKAVSLWTTLVRMSRGRQYEYFVENMDNLVLNHEQFIIKEKLTGHVVCPHDITRLAAIALNREVKTAPSTPASLEAVINGAENEAAVLLNSVSETEWLYLRLLKTPLFINEIVPAESGKYLAVVSKNLIDIEANTLISVAFSVEHNVTGSFSQAIALFSDFDLQVEYVKVDKNVLDSAGEQSMVFLDFIGNISSKKTRSALYQLQCEHLYSRVLGYRNQL